MNTPRLVMMLVVMVLLLTIFIAWGAFVILDSSGKTNPPLPTLAEVGEADSQPAAPSVDNLTIQPDSDNEAIVSIDNTVELPEQVASDQYVLEFDTTMSADDMTTYIKSHDVVVVEDLVELNRVVVVAEPSTIQNIQSDGVVTTEPDYYASALLVLPPTDPLYDQQWNVRMIGAPALWTQLPASIPIVRVAVIDSGICADHPDMQGTFSDFQYDYVENDQLPQDNFGHGCSVTGVIASQNNDLGMIGIAPFVEIMPLRVLNEKGIGTYSHIARAIVDAADHGAQVINLSLGGRNDSNTLRAAIDYALERDVYVVAATGNDGASSPLYPAIFEGVIAVGSVNAEGDVSEFSNRGEDTLAPGEGVIVPYLNGNYGYRSGTSIAAPHVSGAIALELAIGQEPAMDRGIINVGTDIPTVPDTVRLPSKRLRLPDSQTEPQESQPTDRWIVHLRNGATADAVAQSLGYENLGHVGNLENYYVFRVPETDASTAQVLSTVNALSSSPDVIEFNQEILKYRTERQLPADPAFSDQWHLNNTGQNGGTIDEDINALPAWNGGFTGSDVTIAIVDDGLQHTHPDIATHYDATGSYDFNGSDPNSIYDTDNDPAPETTDDTHGTSVGGVVAADDNTTCGVGVAYDASLSGIRLIAEGTLESQEVAALTYSLQSNDIFNNSWGPEDSGDYYEVLGSATEAALSSGVTNGRDGKGAIYVFAAGNGLFNDDNSNYDSYANSRYTIAVGATDRDGILGTTYLYDQDGFLIVDGQGNPIPFYYSEGGANVFVNAPSANVTSDLLGTDGYNNFSGYPNDCNDSFSGTSAAAPVVSGVIALMLDANPNLTWRDVQYILAETADKNDPSDSSWQTNAAGYHTNYYYGFGRINASTAVELARNWVNVRPQLQAGPYSSSSSTPVTIPDGTSPRDGSSSPGYGAPWTSKIVDLSAESIQFVEMVEVAVDITHDYRGDLVYILESPEGTSSLLALPRIWDDSIVSNATLKMTSKDFWGETASGEWTLHVSDGYSGATGTLNDWTLTIYGTDGTYVVNTTADDNGNCTATSCSLREAIIAANAYGDGAVVSIPAGTYTLSIPGMGEDNAATGDLDITANIHVLGAGRDQTIIDANSIDRVFDVRTPNLSNLVWVMIKDMTVQNGQPENNADGGGIMIRFDSALTEIVDVNVTNNSTSGGDGGGIANFGTLSIAGSMISNNQADTGGGIHTGDANQSAWLTVHQSTVDNNTATSSTLGGGGLYIVADEVDYILARSTVSNNTAQNGGGIYFADLNASDPFEDLALVHNVTISGNNARSDGGGIYYQDYSFDWKPLIEYTTITNNTADSNSDSIGTGGGLYAGVDVFVQLTGSILYGNHDNNGNAPDCWGDTTSEIAVHQSFVGDTDDCFLNNAEVSTINYFGVDPGLLPLADNGGPTLTHALPSDSPALSKTLPFYLFDAHYQLDQRGSLRTYSEFEPGAVEYTPTPNPQPELASVNVTDWSDQRWGTQIVNYYPGSVHVIANHIQDTLGDHADSQIGFLLYFDTPMYNPLNAGLANAVTNPDNYLIVADGPNGVFDSNGCTVDGDDILLPFGTLDANLITVPKVRYFNNQNIVSLHLEATDLTPDFYRIVACNLVDEDGNPLDGDHDGTGGDNLVYDFSYGDYLRYFVNTNTLLLFDWIPQSLYPFGTYHVGEVVRQFDFIPSGDYLYDDPAHPNSPTNPDNSILVDVGANGVADTSTCGTVQVDDIEIPITHQFNETYNQYKYNLSGGPYPSDGKFRFISCNLVNPDNSPFDGDWDGFPGGDFVTDFTVFAGPTFITGTTTSGQIHLDWDDPTESETGFAIERRQNTEGAPWVELTVTEPNATTYTDSPPLCNTTYSYRIQTRRDTDMTRSRYSLDLNMANNCEEGFFAVNTSTDSNDGTCDANSCSLREAIIAANAYGDGAVVSIPDGIYTLSITGTGEDNASTGDLDITANIHVVGAGRDQTIIDADGIDRVFDIWSRSKIEYLKIIDGSAPAGEDGGGIRVNPDPVVPVNEPVLLNGLQILSNSASISTGGGLAVVGTGTDPSFDVYLSYSRIDGNSAQNGGGISLLEDATLYVSETGVSTNQASASGGGFYSKRSNGLFEVTLSTIANNSAQNGGGIYLEGGSWITTSTISENTAIEDGGGLYLNETSGIVVFNSTIAGNIADADSSGTGDGGGIASYGGPPYAIDLGSSLVADNIDNGGEAPDCHSGSYRIDSYGRNIFGDTSGCLINTYTYPSLIYNHFDYFNVDPDLLPLADNGGYTSTHAIPADSPAVDRTPPQICGDVLTYDQRGVRRGFDTRCDVGAYEYNDSASPIPPEIIVVRSLHYGPIMGYATHAEGTRIVNHHVPLSKSPKTLELVLTKSLKDMIGDSHPNDVNNPANYLLVADGANAAFETSTCGAQWGDDTTIIVDSIWHSQAYNTIFLNVNGGTALLADNYRLIACNLTDQEGNVMVGDFLFDFVISDTLTLYVALDDPSNTIRDPEVIHEYDVPRHSIKAVFKRDAAIPAGDSDANDVTNPNNYRIVTDGTDGVFQTDSCTVTGDDQSLPVGNVTYHSDDYIKYSEVHLVSSMVDDRYRFIVCDGIEDLSGQALDGDRDGIPGGDTVSEFIIFPKPTHVTTIDGMSGVNLSWDELATSETGYAIERRVNQPANGWVEIGVTNADVTRFVDSNAACGTEYVYRVQTRRDTDMIRSGYSNEVVVNISCGPLQAPDNLVANAVSGTQVDLSWHDNDDTETSYKIERRQSGQAFVELAEVSTNATAYQDTTVICGTTYEYRIQAYRVFDDAYSAYSNIATVTPLCGLSAPTLLSASKVVGEQQLNLNWVDNSTSETEFRIERSPAGAETWVQIDTVGADMTTYLDTDLSLTCYTAYDYRVIAYRANDSSISQPSNVVTGTISCAIVYAPTNLTGTATGITITLSWTDNSPDEDNFQILRTDVGQSNWSSVGTSAANVPVFNDNTTACGSSYDYQVLAQRNGTDSDPSDVVTIEQVCQPPLTPSDLIVTIIPFSNDLQLDWTDNALTETGYAIQRSPDGVNGWTTIATIAADSTTYTDTAVELTCYTPYHYRVIADRSLDNKSSQPSVGATQSTWCDPPWTAGFPISDSQTTSDISHVSGFPQPSCAPNMNHAYVWEFVTVNNGAPVGLNTFGSSIDTVLSIWQFDGTNYVEVGCDDNSAIDGTSALTGSFGHGTRHMVIVGGKNSASGTIVLNAHVIITPTPSPVPTDTPVPTPTQAPNTTTVGLFTDGLWVFRDANTSGNPDIVIRFGTSLGRGWQPLVGDWNGDGEDGIGLYKSGRWLLRDVAGNGTGVDYQFHFGNPEEGWQAVVGDWDGDGDDGIGLYKDGVWLLTNSLSAGEADHAFHFNPGSREDAIAIAGDWHDQSRDRVGLYTDGMWYLSYEHRMNSNARVFQYGPTDGSWLPVVGDWDKDGDVTVGIYKDGGWRLRNSNSRGYPDLGMNFGLIEAVPVAGYRGDSETLMVFAGLSDTLDNTDQPTPLPTSTRSSPDETPVSDDVTDVTPTAIRVESTDTVTATTTTESTLTPSATWVTTSGPSLTPDMTSTTTSTATIAPTETPMGIVPENVSGT